MSPRHKKRKVAPSVRRKISRSLKAYYQEQKRIEETRARQRERERARVRWRAAERVRAEEARQRRASARRGWETRRAHEQAAIEREARRLAKWRKSYREFLKFRIPKKERKKLKIPEKRELFCRVLFDSEETGYEHFWRNVRELLGDSIGNILARIPAQNVVVRATFNLISGEEFVAMQAGTMDEYEAADAGEVHALQWETDVDLEAFWEAYYDNARTLLPPKPEKKTTAYQSASLILLRLEVCYRPGEI